MGALLVVGLLAGTWWVLTDARGLGIGPAVFGALLLWAAALPLTVSGLRRAGASARPVTTPPQPVVIDLRDDVVIDLRDEHDLRGSVGVRAPADPRRS